MNRFLLLLPLLLVISIPTAFAQIVETQGENYNIIENFNTGEASWESHPDRIMDGSWQNYALSDTDEKVIFNSNSVGSFTFDKDSCSYSIYGNGFDGEQIIPSVSAMASFQSNGVWSNLPVNNQTCVVEVSEYNDGVFLTSTKVITEDITKDVFISYNGTESQLNVNGTSFNIVSTNGISGYFNGEVVLTEGAVVEKFVQELDLNINKGFKETFKVWHTGDHSLGITQTLHTGESIIIGDVIIDIAQYDGQSFDKESLVDEENTPRILELTDLINYDFDVGFTSLSNVNIIFDGDYKVNLDYASGIDGEPFVGYLEIDPTITTTGSGTFDVTPLWTHTIASGTIDAVALTGGEITALQVDIDATNQFHTLSGTTLIVSYTVNTIPQPPTGLSTTVGIPLGTSWTAPIDDGGTSLTGYNVYRSDSAFPVTPLKNHNTTQETGDHSITTSTGFEGIFHLDTLVEDDGVDFSDSDFSSGWVQTGTEIVATGGEIVYTDVKANAVHRVVKPLGFTASDSLWTMTFKADISAMTHQSGRVNLGLTSDDLSMEASGTDGIYFQFTDWAGGADLRARVNAWDGTSITSCGNVNITSNADGTDYWIKMIRTTPTNVDTFIYSDEALTTLAFTVPSCTIPATITGLDYVSVTSHNAGITPSGMTGVTDDYRLWNGVSAIPTVNKTIYDYSGDDNHAIIEELSGSVVVNSSHIDTGFSNEVQLTNAGLTITSTSYPSGTGAFTINNIITPDQTTAWTLLSAESTAGDILFNVDDSFVAMSINSVDIFNKTLSTSMNSGSATAISITRTAAGVYDLFINGTSQALGVTDVTSLGTITNDKWYMGMKPDLTNSGTWRSDEFSVESQVRANTDEFGLRIIPPTVLTTTSAGTTNYDDGTVVGGNTYYYSIKAENTIGLSDYIAPFVSGLAGTPPDEPTSIATVISSPNTSPLDVTVSWSSPADVGSGTLSGFEVYRDGVLQTTTGLVTSYTDTVPNSGTFVYSLKAVSNHGTSILSTTSSITTANAPDAITDLAASPVSDTTINLTWSEPSSNGSNIVDYTLYRDGVLIDTSATTGFSDVSLVSQTSYDYTVYARNNVGLSLVSNSITQSTDGVPGVVSFNATTAGLDQINLTWSEPNNYNSAITSYTIERESPTGNGFTSLITLGSVLSYSDTPLAAVTEYNYRITAVNAYGSGATSTSSAITLPAPPTSVVVTPNSSSSELIVTWNTPTLTTGITGYEIFREDGIGTGFSSVSVETGVTFTDTGLTPNIYYNYKLASVTAQGNSAYSNTYSQTSFHLPDSVQSLVATSGELIDATLTWSSPVIPYGSIINYNILQSVVGTPTAIVGSSTGTSYTATNLDPTTTYFWIVAPVTIHGTNSTGNIANATATSEIVIGNIGLSTDTNPDSVSILFNEVRNGNSTALTVTYGTGTDLNCEFDYKFARTNYTLDGLAETAVSGSQSSHIFTFNDSANEIISVHCYDDTANPGGDTYINDQTDGRYQINFATQPIVTQVNDFQKGAFGISSGFGAFDLMTMLIVIISMLGFNRKNPAVGVGVMVAFIGAMGYFGIIEVPTIMMGIIALVVVLAIGNVTKK